MHLKLEANSASNACVTDSLFLIHQSPSKQNSRSSRNSRLVDFGLIIFVFSSISRSTDSAAQKERLLRMEDRLNFLLEHLGAEYFPHDKESSQRLADDNQPEKVAMESAEQCSTEEKEATNSSDSNWPTQGVLTRYNVTPREN